MKTDDSNQINLKYDPSSYRTSPRKLSSIFLNFGATVSNNTGPNRLPHPCVIETCGKWNCSSYWFFTSNSKLP
ncbi:hypothetical protein KIN20_013859 [Parelaphostrongylus tenuis]|uniref:Uncharacterized protein n=1 Tax=Parelaphostrongylus tenuis TaxID=148309 RepID=A0AAD5MY42_PARTN|nr:hypothetical protein KIN20_013859 [Parelaphostrongylus tenuis]